MAMLRVILSATLFSSPRRRAPTSACPPGRYRTSGRPFCSSSNGVVAGSRRPAERKGFTAVSFAFVGSDAHQWIGVNEARTVGGEQPLDGKAVLEQVEPFTPNFPRRGRR